jgi:hypothetical protein
MLILTFTFQSPLFVSAQPVPDPCHELVGHLNVAVGVLATAVASLAVALASLGSRHWRLLRRLAKQTGSPRPSGIEDDDDEDDYASAAGSPVRPPRQHLPLRNVARGEIGAAIRDHQRLALTKIGADSIV